MNLLKGKIKLNGKASFVTEDGIALPLASAPQGSDGRPAIYGIRPEHFALGGQAMKAEVSVLEPTGSETQVFAKVGAQKIVGVFRERITAKPGEALPMAPDPKLVHLFDKETGLRLN